MNLDKAYGNLATHRWLNKLLVLVLLLALIFIYILSYCKFATFSYERAPVMSLAGAI